MIVYPSPLFSIAFLLLKSTTFSNKPSTFLYIFICSASNLYLLASSLFVAWYLKYASFAGKNGSKPIIFAISASITSLLSFVLVDLNCSILVISDCVNSFLLNLASPVF